MVVVACVVVVVVVAVVVDALVVVVVVVAIVVEVVVVVVPGSWNHIRLESHWNIRKAPGGITSGGPCWNYIRGTMRWIHIRGQ